jgi:pimeloyl-ACP methyl ester carboxylesterase/DNA-binding CsgD family transcriptional regulator
MVPEHSFIQQLYASHADSNRFEELLIEWAQRLDESLQKGQTLWLEQPELRAHIRQAVAIFNQLGCPNAPGAEAAGDPGLAAVPSGPYPRMLCDKSGGLTQTNLSAESLYGVRQIDELPFQAETLAALKRALVDLFSADGETTKIVAAQTLAEPTSIIISLHRLADDSVAQQDYVLLSTSEFNWPSELTALLRETFRLTLAESEVLRLLVGGASVEAVAVGRGCSIATVRTQIRAIHAKTGVHTQAEMTQLAVGFVSLVDFGRTARDNTHSSVQSAAETYQPTLQQRHMFTLDNGRSLAYADFGDPNGQVVLYLHDEYLGDHWSVASAQQAVASGLRIVAPARPLYGRSSAPLSGVEITEQFSRDVECLLDALGIGDFVVLTQRVGFRFAIRLAHELIGRVRGLVVGSPTLPAQSVDDYGGMTRLARFVSVAIFRNQSFMELLCQIAWRYYREVGTKKFLHLVNKASAEDLALLADPAILRLMELGLEFSTTAGYQGYLHAVRHDPVEAWRLTVACPVHIRCLIGSADPHDRLARAQRCVRGGADLSVRVVDNVGQLFFLSHMSEVLCEVALCWQQPKERGMQL